MAGIHTLNARGNVILPALREHYGWSDPRTFHEIQRFHSDLLEPACRARAATGDYNVSG